MEVDGPDISKYGVVVPNGLGADIVGVVEKPDANEAPSNLALIGRCVLTPAIFKTLRGSARDQVGKFNWQVLSISTHSKVLSKLFV